MKLDFYSVLLLYSNLCILFCKRLDLYVILDIGVPPPVCVATHAFCIGEVNIKVPLSSHYLKNRGLQKGVKEKVVNFINRPGLAV